MITDEEIDKWYNSLSSADRFNRWIERHGSVPTVVSESERKTNNEYQLDRFRQNKRNYYNRMHNIGV